MPAPFCMIGFTLCWRPSNFWFICANCCWIWVTVAERESSVDVSSMLYRLETGHALLPEKHPGSLFEVGSPILLLPPPVPPIFDVPERFIHLEREVVSISAVVRIPSTAKKRGPAPPIALPWCVSRWQVGLVVLTVRPLEILRVFIWLTVEA